ncbi:pathogenesis-related protein 1 [Eucalyptus grandis]|uniref:pathogenesis-related protein 1 n=1 Tax=Eucalyptus grandis TaxID=71139 RepID=UPI00192ECE40|nr:pathogenesis-related protein 1 [Eucalyptus grandis]
MSSRMSVPLHNIFLVALALALIPLSIAQDSPQDYVAAHNAARSQVGVDRITWDERVAGYARDYAQKHARDCTRLVHSGGPYGENLAWASPDLTGTRAVNMWVGEKPYYNYNSNSCAPGKVCGHYTQVVWRNSVRLGCAKAKCATGGTLVTCNYDPPGNYVGQKPY